MRKKLLNFYLICFAINSFSIACANAQTGCTDPQALNFDPAAQENDGSCAYPPTTYFPTQVANLPAAITEASGAEFFDGKLWVHQDGGVSPAIHSIDTLTGAVLETISLDTLENKDWEDLAADDDYLYIGDFGNNYGNRMDFRIYRVKKTDLSAVSIPADTINFTFSDQTSFPSLYHKHNFDCEAFIALGDSLHIFSKRWLDFTTHHYVLPKTPGTHVAQLRDSLDVGFLTSSADVSSDGTILLLGYDTTSATSLWLLWDYPGTQFFAGNKRKITLGNALNMSQSEGIAFRSPTTGFICTERLSVLPQRLLRFDVATWLNNPSATVASQNKLAFKVSPNPFSSEITIDYQAFIEKRARLSVINEQGQLLLETPILHAKMQLTTQDWPNGIYFLVIQSGGQISMQKLVKQ
ncbi:MAG: T9SS type A sorting domain-containing protein [Saprospiraceae bacterium]|nr:T9SS type A sorting domain-containing protein [Saprospiraceae bacterium]